MLYYSKRKISQNGSNRYETPTLRTLFPYNRICMSILLRYSKKIALSKSNHYLNKYVPTCLRNDPNDPISMYAKISDKTSISNMVRI